MISAILAFAASLVVAVVLTPLARKFALRIGAVDHPGERRVNVDVIPRLGGVAIIAAFFAGLFGILAVESEVARVFFARPSWTIGLAIGGLLVCAVGALDDLHGLRAWQKLWGQTAAAGVAYVSGFRIDAIALPFFGNLDMGIFGIVVTTFWIVAIINAINLIDGLDGLAGGIAFFACVTNFVVAAINQDPIVMLLSTSLGGAVLGFLLFNFNPASVFMGDSGSMFLGYVLATTSILGSSAKSSTTVAILVPLIALGVPIMDTLLAMLRRLLERRSIFSADRGHIHHQLLAMGLTHRRAVLILYALSILFTLSSIIISIGRNTAVGAALVVITIAVIGMVRVVGNFDVALRRWLRKERIRPAVVERLRVSVPIVLHQIALARDHEELPELLGEFANHAGISDVEVINCATGVLDRFRWSRSGVGRSSPSELKYLAAGKLAASYELKLPDARAQIQFWWSSDLQEVPPEADILLQLVVDACTERLARTSEAQRAVTTGGVRLRPV